MNVDEDRLGQIIDEKLDIRFAAFFGQVTSYMDSIFEARFRPLETKFDAMLDGFVKRMDNDDVERAAMAGQINRQERWIGELSKNTGTNLSTP